MAERREFVMIQALTTPYLWYTTRATGFVALVLLTLVVSLGTLVANRIGGTIVGRFELNELHRSVSIIAIVFLAIHITTTVVDSYVPTGWISILLPMTSSYKRVPIAVGAVALDLILAVWISSLLKVRIANGTWRFIHWFSWLAYATAIVHTLLTGTDSRHGIGLIAVMACSAVVLAAALWRFFGRPTRAAGRTALSPLAIAKNQAPPPASSAHRESPNSRVVSFIPDENTTPPRPRRPR
jgi:DMSO/TMAO reductase YedYZ heme-binding membrane subunit